MALSGNPSQSTDWSATGRLAPLANDGNPSSYSNTKSGGDLQWVRIDLLQEKAIITVQAYLVSAAVLAVAVGNNGNDLTANTNYGTFGGPAMFTESAEVLVDTLARYVFIYCNACMIQCGELRVYGPV